MKRPSFQYRVSPNPNGPGWICEALNLVSGIKYRLHKVSKDPSAWPMFWSPDYGRVGSIGIEAAVWSQPGGAMEALIKERSPTM